MSCTKAWLSSRFQGQSDPRGHPAGRGTRHSPAWRAWAQRAHLLNGTCRNHSRRNRRPLRRMGRMDRRAPRSSNQTGRIFSPAAQTRSSCTLLPPCWSSPTFQSPDCIPDNDIRISALLFSSLSHGQQPTVISMQHHTWPYLLNGLIGIGGIWQTALTGAIDDAIDFFTTPSGR
jgi:hypothetical protein